MDLDDIKEHYSKMSDIKLEKIAKYDFMSFRLEVREIILEEINKRDLSDSVFRSVEAQEIIISTEDVDLYIDNVQSAPCPFCDSSDKSLVAATIRRARAFVIFSSYDDCVIVGCASCVNKKRTDALIKNALFGIWSVKGLIFHFPAAAFGHISDEYLTQVKKDELLRGFVVKHIGEIVVHSDDRKELAEFMRDQNQISLSFGGDAL